MEREVVEMQKEKVESTGEKRVRVRTTRKVYIPLYIMIIIILGLLGWAWISDRPIDPFALRLSLGFVALLLCGTELHRYYNYYEITPYALIHASGIIGLRERRINFGSISDADAKQNPWQRLLGYGDVDVRLFSRETTMEIRHVNNPHRFVSSLEKRRARMG